MKPKKRTIDPANKPGPDPKLDDPVSRLYVVERRHADWLAAQGNASATVRALIEAAMSRT